MPQTNKNSSKKHFILNTALILASLSLVAILLYFTTPLKNFLTPNYAAEVAKPIEQSLVKAGGVKACDRGDAGRGPDNQSPWYNITFETSLTKDQAASLVSEVAKNNGYKLTSEQSPYDYIDWYADKSNKQSEFSDLESGNIELSINIYSGGDSLSCGSGGDVSYGADRVAITVNVSLPPFKR